MKKVYSRINASDKTHKQNIADIKFPELEGRVTIELFNAETGELEQKVEGKNIVTNAVKDIFASNFFGALSYNTMLPLFQEMFGGVLCFEQEITENASNYWPPLSSDNAVIAHAGQTTYVPETDPEDTTRGNPNPTESAYVTNGYKQVWDFTSTQGNGTISTICLTHKDTGSYWMYHPSFNPLIECQIPYSYDSKYHINLFDRVNGIGYCIVRETSSTPLVIYEIPDVNCITGIGYTQKALHFDPTESSQAHPIGAHTIADTNARWKVLWFEEGREIHLLYCAGNTSTINRKIVDVTDWSITTDTISVAEATLRQFSSTNDSELYPVFTQLDSGGYLYLMGNTSTVAYKLNYNNLADVQVITVPNSNCYSHIGIGNYGIELNYNPMIIDGPVGHTCTMASSNTYAIGQRWGAGYSPNNSPVIFMSGASRWSQTCDTPRLYISKLFLSTIKNLDAPVTKTSTQTMKISYTITEVQENNNNE